VQVVQRYEVENYGKPPLIINIVGGLNKKIKSRKLAVEEPPYSLRNNMATFQN
jgi:hypothetical protein